MPSLVTLPAEGTFTASRTLWDVSFFPLLLLWSGDLLVLFSVQKEKQYQRPKACRTAHQTSLLEANDKALGEGPAKLEQHQIDWNSGGERRRSHNMHANFPLFPGYMACHCESLTPETLNQG